MICHRLCNFSQFRRINHFIFSSTNRTIFRTSLTYCNIRYTNYNLFPHLNRKDNFSSLVSKEIVPLCTYNKSMEDSTNNNKDKDMTLEDKPEGVTPVRENTAEVLFLNTNEVFYNPVQEFNRDLSVAVLRKISEEINQKKAKKINNDVCIDTQGLKRGHVHEHGLSVLEALAASGLRSIRYAKEVPGLKNVIANDVSTQAYDSLQRNIKHNDVGEIVTPSCMDARFDAIDLDPYGSPVIFLDSAVQCVNDGGLLMVTCTDLAILCGNHPETCFAKYGAVSSRMKACHEMALRIVLQCIDSHANRYGRYIVPLLSVSVDFYIRLFVRVYTSPAKCKRSASKRAFAYVCTGCDTWNLQPLQKMVPHPKDNTGFKFSVSTGPPTQSLCAFCNHPHQVAGPVWTDPIHDQEFVSSLKQSIGADLGTARRIEGILALIEEELMDVPLFHCVEKLSSTLRVTSPNMLQIRSAIMNAGYRVSLSHSNRTSVKTDAPHDVIWDIMRSWEKLHPCKRDRISEGSPAYQLLNREPKLTADFTIRQDANPPSREAALLRFQVNPAKNWGPGTKATTRVCSGNENEKRIKNQGKRKRKKSPDSLEAPLKATKPEDQQS